MPKISASGIVIEKRPNEIQCEQDDVVAILSLVLVERPPIGDISQLLSTAMAAAYVRGFEAGARLASRADRRETEAVE